MGEVRAIKTYLPLNHELSVALCRNVTYFSAYEFHNWTQEPTNVVKIIDWHNV